MKERAKKKAKKIKAHHKSRPAPKEGSFLICWSSLQKTPMDIVQVGEIITRFR
jgi:hypothetical protein